MCVSVCVCSDAGNGKSITIQISFLVNAQFQSHIPTGTGVVGWCDGTG